MKDWFQGEGPSNWDRIFVLDGGVSTLLEHRNGEGFVHRELWSSSLLLLEDGKSLIRQAHSDWLTAGANILTTVTYQCHFDQDKWPPNLISPDRMKQMYSDGVDLVREAIDSTNNIPKERPTFAVVSSGCYGAALSNGAEYTGDYTDHTDESIEEFHSKKLQYLLTLPIPVNGIAIETVPSLRECKILVKALPKLPWTSEVACWVSLSCRDSKHLNDGTVFEKALEVLLDCSQIHAIGINCSHADHTVELSRRLTRKLASRDESRGIVIYPNSGESWNAETCCWEKGTGCTDPEEMAKKLLLIIQAVEDEWRLRKPSRTLPRLVVGGCCRTSPASIDALRSLVDDHLQHEYKGWF